VLHAAPALQRRLDRLSTGLDHRRRPGSADRDGVARGHGSGYAIAAYIAFCAVVSVIATVMLPDHTNRDFSQEDA